MDLIDPPHDSHNGPIHAREEWHDHDLLTVGQFCTLIHTSPRTARDWRRRATDHRSSKLGGTGRLSITVAEVLLFARTGGAGSRGEVTQPEGTVA